MVEFGAVIIVAATAAAAAALSIDTLTWIFQVQLQRSLPIENESTFR